MHEDVFDAGAFCDGLVDDGLELYLRAAAPGAILREDELAGGVVDAVDDGLRGEAPEDDRMHGADARAGKQRHRELRAHAHVDGHAIAFADAELAEYRGETLDLPVQLGVGDGAHLAGFAFPKAVQPFRRVCREHGGRRSCSRGSAPRH